ncbi:hypothetical protein B0H65DRAFT_417774 [Neurospora tetraspora]|uniref:R3H domain-containing protein n=1 Tax=Neurospora tetraspora TaxID=94610 RepID=A0AAE0JNY4_9PEZI|nr:hypothetical protein B0H65DRAFT_417774 [Neurospora tetraspora]
MADVQTATPQGGSGRGGRGGRGRGRGRGGRPRRGHHQGSERPNTGGETAQPAQLAEPSRNPTETASVNVPPPDAPSGPSREGGGRRRRGGGEGGPRRGRGVSSAQRSIVVSHRGRAPPPGTVAAPPAAEEHGNESGAGLSADAPAFVPGQPLAVPTQQPRAARARPQREHRPAPPTASKSSAPDLTTRIHEDIANGLYECVICTNELTRNTRIWSCSVCWTVTHLSCVKKWHANQEKNAEQQEQNADQPLTWRCPGCNSQLVEKPGPDRCWCKKEIDPKPIPGLPPHTCGQTCSKPRATCPHPCSLMCHAGPCPPCTLMGPSQTCYCGKHTSTKRCSETEYGKGFSCEEVCGDLLPCGEHFCEQTCHPGLCGACEVPLLSTCYCGKEQKEIPCDQRDEVMDSFNYGQLQGSSEEADSDPWFEGSFRCSNICGRPFDCGHHTCQKPCHPQNEESTHCPFSPDVVTRCPCGKTPLTSLPVPPRQSCQDSIPHCDKPCHKVLPCGHLCEKKCHTGPCGMCSKVVDISCRCGRTVTQSACHQGTIEHPMCFRVCKVQLNCGRHECGERCCPGEKKAAERRKKKNRGPNENYEAEHICLQVCGRTLKCGQHTCQQLCHKGQCPSCVEAVFDEISCNCGRTVLYPPQPCGTRPPECRFPCRRRQPCGHPTVPHPCHPDDTPCPKCPSLMDKPCICGKEIMKNRPCWNNEVHCGLPCGKKLKCGSHVCKKTCHKPGDCEDAGIPGSHCAQACGKVRKSCEHTCAEQCHAPYPCKEDKPCQSKTFITCPCQNRKQEVRCMATMLNPSSTRESSLKCDDECLRLQRNRKLVDALKIDDTHTDDHIPYSDKTLKMFKENVNWAQTQEREFRVFASSPDEKRLRFKPMPSSQRAFLHSLAEDFGLDSESQDPEPHRHVCIFKTPRFVAAPTKTLAQCARIAKTAASLKPAAAPVVAPPKQQQPYNALLLKEPRFGLTIEELDQTLVADIRAVAKSGLTAVSFTTNFLPSEEILIKATPASTAAAIANSSIAATPQAVESALTTLKAAVSKTVTRLKLATGGVVLCHADDSLNVVRREAESGAGGAGGWNAVAGRGSWKRLGGGPKTSTAEAEKAAAPLTRSFVTLRKIMEKKPVVEVKKEAEPVEEDWLAAVEKEEEEEQEKEKSVTSGSDFEGEAEGQSKNASVSGDVQEGNGVVSDTEQSVDSAAVHEEKEPEPSSVDGGSFWTGEQAETETETEIMTAPETNEAAATMNA